MITGFIILIFVLSVAIAAGSILIASKLRAQFNVTPFSSLIYFLAFYFTYGFYAIWGQVLFISFLSPFVSADILRKTVNILIILGSPFVVLSWLMLLKVASEISGKMIRNSFMFLFLTGNIMVAFIAGFLLAKYSEMAPFNIILYGFVILHLFYSLAAAWILLFHIRSKTLLRVKDMRNLALGIFLSAFLPGTILVNYHGNVYIALSFILLFFTCGAFIPGYIRYKADLSGMMKNQEGTVSFDLLCKTFDISPREKDIILEVCNGLSNQQIADKLFISLQTVKDHTSRIYFKTNCSSRAQLITMIGSKTKL
jgi:DNA-binding CsgD family transcriptional regulator